MIDISKLITAHKICDVSSSNKDEVLVELCDMVANTQKVTDHGIFLQAIKDREKIISTGIGQGIAIPHAQTSAVEDFVVAVGISKEGIDFESLDGLPVQIIILIGTPERKHDEFLRLISQIGTLFNNPVFKEQFLAAGTPSEMTRLLREKSFN